MADLPQAPVTPPPAERLDYQPVSAWAIVGLVLGILIALLVLGSFAISIFSGQPIFLWPETMVIGLAGLVVCFIARRVIQFSEGTRTGMGLAGWGMWLSVFSVLGFTAVTFSTKQALYQQANAFLLEKENEAKSIPDSGFFPRLVESAKDPVQGNCAFLLTLPTGSRAGNPQNEQDMNRIFNIPAKDQSQGRLSHFRNNGLVKLIQATAANDADDTTVKFEPRGRVSCVYDSAKRHYVVTRIYHISTPEVEMDLSIQVNSDEAPEPGVRRRWIVAMPALEDEFKKAPQHATPLGENLKDFRGEVYNHVVRWAKAHPTHPIPFKDLTDYEKLFPDAYLRDHIQRGLKDVGPGDMIFAPPSTFLVAPWKMVDGKLQIGIATRVTIAGRIASPSIISLTLEGLVFVESTTPLDPHVVGIEPPVWNIAYIKWTGYQGAGKR